MNKYKIRFNVTRGRPGRGTQEHVWRVFENDKEILARYVIIEGRSWTEQDENSVNFNIVCFGSMDFYTDTDTAVIFSK